MTETQIANPGPLGLAGFALTTFFLSLVNAGVISGKSDILVVVGLAIFYGGLAQLLAGMWEFRAGNTFGATAFTSYGAFWLSFGALLLPGFDAAVGVVTPGAIGWYLIGWAIFTGIMTLATFRLNLGLVVVFVLLFLTYVVLAIAWWKGTAPATPDKNLNAIGGWLGVLTAIAAWYNALAGVLVFVSKGKSILPIVPFGNR